MAKKPHRIVRTRRARGRAISPAHHIVLPTPMPAAAVPVAAAVIEKDTAFARLNAADDAVQTLVDRLEAVVGMFVGPCPNGSSSTGDAPKPTGLIYAVADHADRIGSAVNRAHSALDALGVVMP